MSAQKDLDALTTSLQLNAIQAQKEEILLNIISSYLQLHGPLPPSMLPLLQTYANLHRQFGEFSKDLYVTIEGEEHDLYAEN